MCKIWDNGENWNVFNIRQWQAKAPSSNHQGLGSDPEGLPLPSFHAVPHPSPPFSYMSLRFPAWVDFSHFSSLLLSLGTLFLPTLQYLSQYFSPSNCGWFPQPCGLLKESTWTFKAISSILVKFVTQHKYCTQQATQRAEEQRKEWKTPRMRSLLKKELATARIKMESKSLCPITAWKTCKRSILET